MKLRNVLAAASLLLFAGMPAPANSAQHKRVIEVPMKVVYARALRTVEPVYPPEAKAKGIQGTVWVKGKIGVDGRVHDLKVVSGPRALVGAAEAAVRQWTFAPATFNGKPRAVPWQFHLRFRLDKTTEAARKVALSRESMSHRLVHKVEPEYPAEAQRKGIHGDVVLRALVGKDGHVKSVEKISGNPILTKAAIHAVRQWVYEPTLIHGQPVDVHLTVTVSFAAPK